MYWCESFCFVLQGETLFLFKHFFCVLFSLGATCQSLCQHTGFLDCHCFFHWEHSWNLNFGSCVYEHYSFPLIFIIPSVPWLIFSFQIWASIRTSGLKNLVASVSIFVVLLSDWSQIFGTDLLNHCWLWIDWCSFLQGEILWLKLQSHDQRIQSIRTNPMATEFSLPGTVLRSVSVSPEGNVWVGTHKSQRQATSDHGDMWVEGVCSITICLILWWLCVNHL